MINCEGRRISKCSHLNDCPFHEECSWCGKIHFVIKEPIIVQPRTYGSRPGVSFGWPPPKGMNIGEPRPKK